MKTSNKLTVVLTMAMIAMSSFAVLGQTPDAASAKTRQRFATKPANQGTTAAVNTTAEPSTKKGKNGADEPVGIVAPDNDPIAGSSSMPSTKTTEPAPGNANTSVSQDSNAEGTSEESEVAPVYANFFNTYKLGPEDIISVSVFGQDRYSRSGIIIPPSGRISLSLIPGGVFVNGKTVDEVAEVITKRYDEYIIDPQVSVSLDKASSYRYSVIGDVAQPGIRLMSRRLTVTEALGEAGGVLPTGDRSKVVVLRKQADGNLKPIGVNVSAIYKGKAPDATYLEPGDQVIVPGNKLKSFQKIMSFIPILSFARIFTGGVWP